MLVVPFRRVCSDMLRHLPQLLYPQRHSWVMLPSVYGSVEEAVGFPRSVSDLFVAIFVVVIQF